METIDSKSTSLLSQKDPEYAQGRFLHSTSTLRVFRVRLTVSSINLAYAELYIIIAGMVLKYDVYDETTNQKTPTLALFDTTRERDIDMEFDLIVPFPQRESKGVRVIVR